MTVYYLLFTGTLFLSFFSLVKSFPTHVATVLLFVVVAFLVTLAYGTNDYAQYRFIYDNVVSFEHLRWLGYSVNIATPVEPAFALLILLEKSITGSFVVFWFAFTAVSLLVKFYAFKKLSPFMIVTILLYLSDEYFWKDLSGIRGAMSSGLVLLSVYFAWQRQPVRFVVAIIAALSFHFAAIVAAPIYWYRAIGKPTILAGIFLTAVLIALFGGVGLLLPEIAAKVGMVETSRLIKYVESRYVSGIRPFGGTFILHMCIVSLLLAAYRPLTKVWRYSEILIPVYIYGTAVMFAFIDYGIIAGRTREMLCVPVGAVLLPSFILVLRGQQKLIAYCGVVAYAALWFFLMTQSRYPYQSVLFVV